MMMSIAIATQYAILAYLIYQVLAKHYDLLDAYAFLCPYKAIAFSLGLTLYAYQVIVFLLFLEMLLFMKWSKVKLNGYLLLYLTYVVVSTIIISNFFIDNWIENIYGTFFRGRGRYIFTLILMLVFQFPIVFAVITKVKTKKKIHKLLRAHLRGCILLMILAFIQLTVFVATGNDIYPMGMNSENHVRSAVHNLLSNYSFVRINALGGEPKGLAASMCMALALVTYSMKFEIGLVKRERLIFWLLIVTIFLTLSTGGYGLMMAFFVITFFLDIIRGKIRLKTPTVVQSFIAIAFIVAIIVFHDKIYHVFEVRFLERADQLAGEESDGIIQDFLLDNPKWGIFGSGSGNIHNLADPYMPEQVKYYLKGNIFIARNGYLKSISENGIVGFFLLCLFYGVGMFKLFRRAKNGDVMADFLFYLMFATFWFYFVRGGYVWYAYLLFISLGLVYFKIAKNEEMQLLNEVK